MQLFKLIPSPMSAVTTALCASAIAASATLAQINVSVELDSSIKTYAVRCNVARQLQTRTLRKELLDLRNNRKLEGDEKKARAEVIKHQLEELEDPLKPFYGESFHFFTAAVGDVGWFDKKMNGRRVYQVIGIKAFQIVDRSNVMIEITSTNFSANTSAQKGRKLMWLTGIDTSTLENGGDVELNELIAVTGNKTYETADGSHTVLVLQIIDPQPYNALFTRKGEKRTWTSDNGHTTEAIYTRYENGRVVLTGVDGKIMKVRLSDLSHSDREFVSAQIKASAKTK